MTITPEQVAACFSRCTGIKLRYLSHNQQHLLSEFVKHFTILELESVVLYVQKEIQGGRLDARSLQFHCIFGEFGGGNEFSSFQNRLALAQKTVRTRPIQREVPTAVNIDGKNKIITMQPAPEPEPSTTGALVAEQLKAFKRSLQA